MPRFSPSAPALGPLVMRFVALAGRDLELDAIHRVAVELRDDPRLLRNSLLAIAHDDGELEAVRARSAGHPNGFAKLVLHVGDGWSIRLHVWPSNGEVVDVNPHGHRWVFASWIVTGTLQEIIFAETPGGDWFDRCDYSRDSYDQPYLGVTGAARLSPVEPITRSAGTVYARDQSVLHTAEPVGGELVASLVLQGPKSFDPTPVYRRPGVPLPESLESDLTVGDLRFLLTAVAAAIT